MVYIRRQGTHTAGCAGPDIYPLTATERTISVYLARGHKAGTTSYILQRGFTATSARCWAALYGVGFLSVRAAKAVSLCLARATSRHFFSFLGKRRAHSGRHRQLLTVVQTKSLQNSGFIGELGRISRHFIVLSKKIPAKKFLRYRRCAIHARFVAVSY